MKLNAKARNKLAGDQFGLPAQRAYPMPDKGHAADAKARASEEEAAGNLSEGEEDEIDTKANRVLKRPKY